MTILKELVCVTGEYQAADGTTKKRWKTVGHLHSSQDGKEHIDLIHFGIVMMLNIAIGMATPPFGVNLFVTCSIAKISIEDYAKEIWPFIAAMVISLLLITYIPEISLFLPKLLSR